MAPCFKIVRHYHQLLTCSFYTEFFFLRSLISLRKLSKIQSIVEHRAAGRLVSSVMGHWCWALLQNRQLQSALRTGQRHFSTKAAERALYTWVCYAEARRQYASQMSVAIGAWSPSAISRGFRAWSSWLQEAHIAIRKYVSDYPQLLSNLFRAASYIDFEFSC